MNQSRPSHFIDMIQRYSHEESRVAFSFVRNAKSDVITRTLTYQELHASALRIAARLAANGDRGQRVLLLFPDGLDFVSAFVGCLYAGATAVPAPLPDRFRTATDRAAGILRDAGATTLLTDGAHHDLVSDWLAEQDAPEVPCLDTTALADGARGWCPRAAAPADVAFLQYTSGSTSDPKGVVVSHGNLMANLETIHHTIGTTGDLRAVGWLPAIHDMGLVGQLLSVLYVGGHLVLMPPNEFLRYPYRWLSLIGEFRATHTVAPNFAYDLCLRRVTDEQVSSLDLSSLEVVLNGAEPIRADTLDAFAERFAPAGFDRAAFSPCYGMAEATLLVSGSPRLEPPVITEVDADALAKGALEQTPLPGTGRRLVSSGRPRGCSVLIVDPHSAEVLPDGSVGEIWLRGDSVARGYWRRAESTLESFRRTPSLPGDPGGWLRTGDLGALVDGELFVTGRLKDVIVVNGRNLYPQDMEYVARDCHEEFRSGSCAVFGLSENSGHVVVVQEARPRLFRTGDPEEAAGNVRRALSREFDIAPRAVLLVRPGTVRKTTSGKVRRALMRQMYLDGALEGALYEKNDPVGILAGQKGKGNNG